MKSDKVVSNVSGSKQTRFAGFKTTSAKPTEDQLKLINQFTRTPFSADDMYTGQLRLANNCIDRDNERFSEEVLQRFAATAIRKTMLFDHGRNVQDAAVGKFFDVTIEKMPVQQANAETGENFQLPPSKTEVWFLTCSFYIPIKGVDEQTIVKIDAGVYDFASIGFRCESLAPVMDKDGKILFWEYRGTGPRTEMTEGSLVYLGAQHGMTVKFFGEESERSYDEGETMPKRNLISVLVPKSVEQRRVEKEESYIDDVDILDPNPKKRNPLKPLSAEERREKISVLVPKSVEQRHIERELLDDPLRP